MSTRSTAVLFAAVLASLVPLFSSSAEAQTTWLDSAKNPYVTKNETISQTEYNELLNARRGFVHQDCIKKKIVIRTKPYVSHYDGCWYITSIGLLEKNGKYLLQPGQQIAGYIKRNTQDTSKLSPTQNPDVFLELIDDPGTGYGYYVNFRSVNELEFEATTSSTGAITFSYKNPGTRLKTTSGSVHVDSSDIWYSDNAKWMVIWSDSGTVIRINLENFKVIRVFVREKPRYNSLTASTAITNDGRYIAVAINREVHAEMYIEDLATCEEAEASVIAASVKCPSRTFKPYLVNVINNYRLVSLPRFYGSDALSVYHRNSDETYTRYNLQAPNTNANTSDYLAMGDSFASGEGAFDYEDGTDDPVNKCHLSKKSYPYLINQQMALSSFRSIACSGAKIENVIGGENRNNQFERPEFIAGEFHPGDHRQIWHINNFSPSIITISMSGNDIGFADKLTYCVAYANDCYDTYEDRLEIIREINNKFDAITDTYRQIKQEALPDAKIYIIGYPQIVSSDIHDKCGANVHLSAQERLFANQLTTYFNKVIKNAAAKAGVTYIGIEGSLSGNRLCEINSAGIAVNGLTAGNDEGKGPIKILGKESYHPNATGHLLMKNAILEKTDYFSKPVPSPDSSSTVPGEIETPLLEAPRSGRKINNTNYDGNSSNNVYYHDGWIKETIDASIHKLIPFRDYFVELHSEPVRLGTVTSDINGDLAVSVQIPASVAPGIHTLHIYGKNTDGDNIDIYRYVYIGASEADFDGDGTPDSQEACVLVEASGIDQDEDGTDDACDGTITTKQENPQTSPGQKEQPSHIPDEPTLPGNRMPSLGFLQSSASTSLQPASQRTTLFVPATPTTDVLAENTHTAKSETLPNVPPNHAAITHHPNNTPKFSTAAYVVIVCSILFIFISIMLYATRRRK